MQARFQKRQMEEKEQKLLRLYESQQQRVFQRVGRGSAGSTASLSSSTSTLASIGGGGGGKVRQLFEERRTNGWDRSYPLEPVAGGKARGQSQQQQQQQQQLPLAVPKTKLARGASLDRSHPAAPKTNVRRSKSHARAVEPPVVNGHVNGHANGHANGHVNGHANNKLYYDGGGQSFRKVDDYNNRNYRRHQQPPRQEDSDDEDFGDNELNYETLGEDVRAPRNDFTVLPENRRQEELFAKYQVRELGNDELLGSASPPPEIYDDGVDEGTFIYEKVGAPGLRNDDLVNSNDRFKTYVSSKHNRPQYREEIVPRAHAMASKMQDAKKAPPPPRRESLSPPTRVARPAPKKVEQKTSTGTKSDVKSSGSGYQSSLASTGAITPKQSASVASKPASSAINKNNYNSNMKSATSQRIKNGSSAPMRSAPSRDDLTECPICHRRFTNDRIKVHEEICAKTAQKRRKEYDATKHRVQGTEAESFVRRAVKGGATQKKTEVVKKADWRKKHEEFIQTIRAAKEAQAHVAAGGKLSDLPPPPPLDTSDYVQCPHCGRRFNEGAADRHIPRCANMQHNKPKPAANKSLPKRR